MTSHGIALSSGARRSLNDKEGKKKMLQRKRKRLFGSDRHLVKQEKKRNYENSFTIA